MGTICSEYYKNCRGSNKCLQISPLMTEEEKPLLTNDPQENLTFVLSNAVIKSLSTYDKAEHIV